MNFSSTISSRRPAAKRAFTLVEILSALAVGTLLMLSIVIIVVMIVIPIPVASFIEAAKRRLRRNQPALIVRDDDGDSRSRG